MEVNYQHGRSLLVTFCNMEYKYTIKTPEGEIEQTLIVESRVEKITEDIYNPSGEEGYYYAIRINGGMEQIQTFIPWAEGYQAMTSEQAEFYCNQEIQSLLSNYPING